jgi:hypothetical protein
MQDDIIYNMGEIDFSGLQITDFIIVYKNKNKNNGFALFYILFFFSLTLWSIYIQITFMRYVYIFIVEHSKLLYKQ